MRAPEWWAAPGRGPWPRLLAPLAWTWGLGARARVLAARPWRAPIGVVCVGNLTAGGAGKTPVAISLGARLTARGARAAFLAHGYGGSARGPLQVDSQAHGAADVGDEALILARDLTTWVARDRRLGVRAAAAAGASVVIMDDGFQDPSVAKDLSVVVVDGRFAFGNGRLIPAGPLRERPGDGLKRADAAIVVEPDEAGAEERIRNIAGTRLPVVLCRRRPDPSAAHLAGADVVAFAGIGRPEGFFATLREMGCRVRAGHAFPDHHAYGAGELERLRADARSRGAMLVTTTKDAARLGPEAARGIEVLTITLDWRDEAALDALLSQLPGLP
ncbi:MAG: tetraacyldisaccharide 4'-kinase [Rhodospirillales bacterium]|nr:tetraacyldisaccharide 4'-kinase [Rhodospirillales bacterium]